MKIQRPIPPIWFYWLFLLLLSVMVFGVSMLLTPELIKKVFSLLNYATSTAMDDKFNPAAIEYITLVHGVLGAVMLGWGAAMLTALFGPFRRGEREGWNMIAIAIVVWFFPDSVFSLWMGFWHNVVLNAFLALLFAVPLAATYKAFRSEGESSEYLPRSSRNSHCSDNSS